MSDKSRVPDYYKSAGAYLDVIDYIESLGDMHGFCRGNIIKYIVRAGKKTTNTLDDLYKAREYINRWIKSEESINDVGSASQHLHYSRLDEFLNDNLDGRGRE